MPPTLPAEATLDREYLEIRAKLLEIGAALDRISRGAGDVRDDPRLGQIQQTLDRLRSGEPGAAAAVQSIFSLPYNKAWRDDFGMKSLT